VTSPETAEAELSDRARQWRNSAQAAVCDVTKPWAHGTILRATRYPSYYDYNVVRVEEDPEMTVEKLVAVADEALGELEHRKLDFDLIGVAERLRPGFESAGWRVTSLLWMRHQGALPPGPQSEIEQVDYDAVSNLRHAWHHEDFPDTELGDHEREAREVALARGARVFAVIEAGVPVAFAQLEGDETASEISQVYVHPEHRGNGRGTALTRAAVEAAGDVRDLWIVADADDRPKDLYARLGFRTAWASMEFLRAP
jgi:ribosomal protein S18 acetylase RimI-like enzyme